MQHEKVADTLEFEIHQPVVFAPVRGFDRRSGKQVDEIEDTALDQVDAGRLERFKEPAGETDGDAITLP